MGLKISIGPMYTHVYGTILGRYSRNGANTGPIFELLLFGGKDLYVKYAGLKHSIKQKLLALKKIDARIYDIKLKSRIEIGCIIYAGW